MLRWPYISDFENPLPELVFNPGFVGQIQPGRPLPFQIHLPAVPLVGQEPERPMDHQPIMVVVLPGVEKMNLPGEGMVEEAVVVVVKPA